MKESRLVLEFKLRQKAGRFIEGAKMSYDLLDDLERLLLKAHRASVAQELDIPDGPWQGHREEARSFLIAHESFSESNLDSLELILTEVWINAFNEALMDELRETVNHPSHYGGAADPYEAIKVIFAWKLDFCLGNTLKYIRRRNDKGSELENLKKARFYLDWYIRKLEEGEEQ